MMSFDFFNGSRLCSLKSVNIELNGDFCHCLDVKLLAHNMI